VFAVQEQQEKNSRICFSRFLVCNHLHLCVPVSVMDIFASFDIYLVDELYENATLAEVLYKFSKGIQGVRRIPLTENPRFYHGLSGPYNTAESLGIKTSLSGSTGSIPSKSPESNLSTFLGATTKNVLIHVFFDRAPRIMLECQSAPCQSLSLAKWNEKIPGAILRGNVHHIWFAVD
jgi:hypothetical protein